MITLELSNVSKRRGAGPHAVQALEGVSLAVDAGELVLLEGPSGSGKTTLLALAAGLLRADSGQVRLAGDVLGPDTATRRRRRARLVGFVFQRGNLLPGLTARENVLLQARLAGMSAPERQVDEILEALGVHGLASRRPDELSGGEEQRVAVARALVHRPALVLADEPTASLDGHSGCAVSEQLRALGRARGAAILVATHDPRLLPYATRRVRLLDGRIQEEEASAWPTASSAR